MKFKTFGTLLLVLGLVIFGVSQYYLNQTYRRQLEASYQRAFRELSVHIDSLEAELSKLQVANSVQQQFDSTANLLRLVYASQANLGQLPLNSLNLTRIENLLAKVQSAAVKLVQGSFQAEPPHLEEEFAALYQQVQFVNGELQTQLALGERRTSWVDWRRYVQTSISRVAVEPDERYPLMQALVMIEDGMDRFTDSDFASELERLRGPLPLGEPITEKEAVARAEAFMPQSDSPWKGSVTNRSEGELPTYTITLAAEAQSTVLIEVAKQGGHILWMSNPRIVGTSQLSHKDMATAAAAFLKQRGFPQVELVDTDLRLNRLMCSFAVVEAGVLIYPQQLKVQVAADNGGIVGFQGAAYHSFSRARELTPALTAEEAQAFLKPTAEVLDQRLAVILDSDFNEVLTYQFRVNHGSDQFLIYINAADGSEEKIIRVEPGDVSG